MKKFIYYYILVLIVFLPLQKLFEALVGKYLPIGATYWLSHWYEFGLILVIMTGLIQLIRSRTCPNFKLFIQPALYLIVFGILSVLFLSPTISRGMEGFRFALLPVVFLLVAYAVQLKGRERSLLVRSYLIMSIIIAAWAVIERFLPYDYWSAIGLNNFGWGQFEIEHRYYQSASLFNAPNQLAAYLLPAFFLMFHNIIKLKKLNTKTGIAIITILIAIILTFSRSAALGLVAGLLTYSLISPAMQKFRYHIIGCIAAIALVLYLAANYYPPLQLLVQHGDSSSQHQELLQKTQVELKSRNIDLLIIGRGLGTAGPSAIKYGDGITSESWYLQLILEMGAIGLILWLWLILSLIYRLLKSHLGLAIGILSISIVALFLHTWADNPALACTLFIMSGLYIHAKQD